MTLPCVAGLFLAGLVSSGCTATGWRGADLDARYQAAIADAAEARPEEIFQGLRAVVPYEPGLVWERVAGESRVLVVTWTQWDGYDDKEGQEVNLTRPVWVTLVPDVQEFCREYRPRRKRSLELRLEQLMGLGPGSQKTRFVELWVDPAALLRPCPDPEVTDRECGLDFPSAGNALVVNDSYRSWFEELEESSYVDDGFPWTRLGYTYDWGGRSDRGGRRSASSVIGLSELVIPEGAQATVKSVASTQAYCRSPAAGTRR